MAVKHAGVEVTFTTTESGVLPLGFEFEESHPNQDRGVRVWRWIQMTGSAAAVGEVIARTAGDLTAVGALAGATTTKNGVHGVAQHVIAQDSYGFVLRRGVGQVLCDGSVPADTDVQCAASGEVAIFATGNEHRIVGFALAIDAGPSTLVPAYVNCE